jgi:hypothetical protein
MHVLDIIRILAQKGYKYNIFVITSLTDENHYQNDLYESFAQKVIFDDCWMDSLPSRTSILRDMLANIKTNAPQSMAVALYPPNPSKFRPIFYDEKIHLDKIELIIKRSLFK